MPVLYGGTIKVIEAGLICVDVFWPLAVVIVFVTV